jgi:uncharacterized protein
MPAPRGRFTWHELMTTDPDRAVGFYTKVAGWKVQTWERDPSYRLWTVGGVPIGGLMRQPEESRRSGAPPSWLTYIAVPDVDAAVRQATSLRGRTLVPPRDLRGTGRFAVLADPQGAVFAVYKSATQETTPDDLGVGDFSWHELATTDYRAAWEFYRALFGWEATESLDMGPEAGIYWMFGHAGESVGGIYNKVPTMPVANWLPYVLVRSVDDAATAVTRSDGQVVNGPMEVPGGDRIAQCIDPQGAAFAVHQKPLKAARRPEPRPARKARAGKKPAARKRPRRPARKRPAKKTRRARRRR